MKYLTLVTIDSPIELDEVTIGNEILHGLRDVAPNTMVTYGAAAIARAIEPALAELSARVKQNMLRAARPAPAPSSPHQYVLNPIISKVRELLGSQVDADSQPDDFDEQVTAYTRLVAFMATGYLDPNIDVLTLTRAALTAGLTD